MKSAIELQVAKKVKEIRNTKKLSTRYFADCLNISESFIRDAENPNSNKKYNLNHLNKIAKILECSLWKLIPEYPL